MGDTAKAMVAIANLSEVLRCAKFLAHHGVLREEDVQKCIRVYVKKHPEINEALARAGRDVDSLCAPLASDPMTRARGG